MLWVVSFAIANLFFESNGDVSLGEKVAVIPIKGMITLEGGSTLLSSTTSGSEIASKIKDANADSQIKAIVLEINSGGGTVLGSKVVADAIKDVEKPIVASISEYGASGAYWIASQTDTIVADLVTINSVDYGNQEGTFVVFMTADDDFTDSSTQTPSKQ